MNIYETLRHSATTWPGKVAIQDEYGSLNYKELFAETEKLILEFKTAGVTVNTGLAIITKNSRHFIIGLYAGVGCGAVVMPVAQQQQPDEIRKSLSEARLHFIFSDDEIFSTYGNSKIDIESETASLFLSRTGFDVSSPTVSFVENVAFMRFTSGTTGNARCVILSHQTVLERIEAANEALQVEPTDNVVWVLPMAYHFVVSILLYIRYGAGIIICNDFLAEHLLGKIQNHRGTFLYASPMHIRLLAAFPDRVLLPSLRRVVSTTTAVSPEHCKTFREKYHVSVNQAFGIIEIGLPIMNTLDADTHPESVGNALSSYEVAILDSNLNPLTDGAVGLLAIKGPGMFDGYLSPPTTRAAVLKNGWFITGDYASRLDGRIEIKGREKSMISVSGNKVFPDEIEEVINTFEGVKQSRAYGQPHPLFGEVVVADVILEHSATLDEDRLLKHCRNALSGFKVPQRITQVDAIEMTASGKIKRS